jgi:hypothetical protein
MFFIDTSREVYMPMMMNKGFVLYKDILNVYTPLAYQINACFLKILGENLKTFYLLGFINSSLFLSGFFLLSKRLLKKSNLFAFLTTLVVLSLCIYAVSLSNYIFPYSYSIVYSLTAFVFSLLFLFKYIENKQFKNIVISFFLFGLCLDFKPDFFLFGLILFPILFIFKLDFKQIIYSLLAFLIMPIISTLILFYQGVTILDLIQSTKFILLLASAKSVKVCYEYLGLIPNIASFKIILRNFFIIIPILSLIFYSFYKLQEKKKIYSIILFIILFFIFKPFLIISNSFYFNWIGISIILFTIFLLLKREKTNYDKNVLIFNFSVILASIKCIFSINFNNYGTYYFPFVFLVFLIFIANYLPKILKITQKHKLKNYNRAILLILLFIFSSYTFSNIERRNLTFTNKISTEKGTIYVEEEFAQSIFDSLNYIKNNTKKDDVILTLPEGAMINFLSDRQSNNKYFYLIPPNIEVFNEDKIVEDLTKNLPKYIVIQPMSYKNFKETYFCESFGNKICNLIPQYYNPPIVFGKNFWIAIYERKN